MANLTFDFLHNYVTGERRASDPADAYQYDEGHVLEAVVPVAVTSCEIQYWIRGMEKADAYTPTSITQNTDNTYTILGNIPNSYFETNGDLRVYIVVTDGDASITTYEGYIHIKERQMPEDYVDDDPENEAVRVIAEARAAAATATEKAGEAAASAEQAQEILDSIPEDYTELTEEVGNLKDDFHSYHSELGAGYADQLVSSIENTDSVPYNFRKVPYDATLEKVDGIVGVDVVLNQLCNGASVTVPNGHKYYMLKGGTASVGASTGTAITGLTSGTDMVFDLTQTFGTAIADYVYSLEQSTAGAGVAWLKEHFPKIFNAGYVPYNAGTMVHVSGLSAKKTVGFNQWDEEYVNGFFNDSGVYTARADIVGSKNAIHVLPNTTYCFNGKASAFVTYWRSKVSIDNAPTGEFISREQMNADVSTFTTPADCHYIFLNMPAAYGTTYKNDICINLSDPVKNGTYEPYEAHEYPLDSTIDLHGILKLDANNNLYADGDVYEPDGSVSRRYGVVDLGTLPWGISSNGNYFQAMFTLTGGGSYRGLANVICSKYPVTNEPESVFNGTIDKVLIVNTEYISANKSVFIRDSSYIDAASLKASLSGVYMVYELATPTTETAEPYQHVQICDDFGTEEYISTTVAPVGHTTKYPLDIAGRLDNILTMPTADGTYTLRATVNNGKVTYSWVSA